MQIPKINNVITNSITFQGLLGDSHLDKLVNSEFYHFSKEIKNYYPFKNETPEQIDAFVKNNSTTWESEVLGEITSASTEICPCEKLNFTKEEFLKYKSDYKNKLPECEKYRMVDTELKSRGLYSYMNQPPSFTSKSRLKSILKFLRLCK